MIKLFFPLALVWATIGISQSDTLNKYNSNGKKHGCWTKYFDLKLNPTDSANSYYYGYNLYNNGYCYMFLANHKHYNKNLLVHDGVTPQKGRPVLLDGTFKWYNKKPNYITLVETYKNGFPEKSEFYSLKSKSDSTTYTNEIFDYTKKYNHEFYSGYYVMYDQTGKISKEWYLRKRDNKWGYYPIK